MGNHHLLELIANGRFDLILEFLALKIQQTEGRGCGSGENGHNTASAQSSDGTSRLIWSLMLCLATARHCATHSSTSAETASYATEEAAASAVAAAVLIHTRQHSNFRRATRA
jgi:hypothetical protein